MDTDQPSGPGLSETGNSRPLLSGIIELLPSEAASSRDRGNLGTRLQ